MSRSSRPRFRRNVSPWVMSIGTSPIVRAYATSSTSSASARRVTSPSVSWTFPVGPSHCRIARICAFTSSTERGRLRFASAPR